MGNSENLAGVRTAYDTVAEAYSEALPDTSFEAPLDMAMINDFCARIRAAPGRKVIDAGCGAGRLSVRLAEAGLDVTGVDLSPGMVRQQPEAILVKTRPPLGVGLKPGSAQT